MKTVRLLCYMFLSAFLDLTVHKVQWHSYHFELTDQQKPRINLFSEQKAMLEARELPTYTTAPAFTTSVLYYG